MKIGTKLIFNFLSVLSHVNIPLTEEMEDVMA